jgi:Gluconate 2-dehydrogenase subunit 3
MICRKHSRRAFLRVMGGAVGGAWLTLDLAKVAQAAHDAQHARESAGTPTTSFLSQAELADVDAITAQIIPTDETFAALSNGQQIEFLTQVERTPFFERIRLLTLVGMFALPKYGGNRDNVGWKLIGFQDQHVFTPPFGYYDRDYPGFQIQVVDNP